MTKKHPDDALVHMIHTTSGKTGVIPESRTEEARSNGFEFAVLMHNPKNGTPVYVPHSKIKEASSEGFRHLYEPENPRSDESESGVRYFGRKTKKTPKSEAEPVKNISGLTGKSKGYRP